jgi:hypothetical protein
MHITKRLAIAAAIGSLIACGSTSPTAPTNANVAGSYDLTFTASSTCSANLPADTRVLKYVANISQIGLAVQIALTGPVVWSAVAINGAVSEQKITFDNFTFGEMTTGGGIALNGTGSLTVHADGSITGTIGGKLQTPGGATCIASNHQVQMIKK